MKVGTEVMTPRGRGFINRAELDRKFDRVFYFVDVPRSFNLSRGSKVKYEVIKFWDYEIKEVTK